MKKENKIRLYVGIGLLLAFILWTILVGKVDVQAVGPQGSAVGFAAMNSFIHSLFGVNMLLYAVTDWLGLVPIATAFGFAILGLIQWIRRKSLFKVDRSLFFLGGFYIMVIIVYIFFEYVVINCRPVLINGHLEASYPSSTTLLVSTVMPAAIIQLNERIKRGALKKCVTLIAILFTAFMILGRLISGVHWVSDIIGSALFSSGVVLVYHSIFKSLE